MLVEFSVENHHAFREKQTFSMVASAAAVQVGIGHATGISAIPRVHREACVFGANGSGKSSLVDAMRFMMRFVCNSFRKEPDERIPVDPFLFHADWREKPSEFEAIFIIDENLYQYGFALTRERVEEEWLFARPRSTGRQRMIFTRSYNEKDDRFDWEINDLHLKGNRQSWRDQTRPDALFLSTAVQFDAVDLIAPYAWFRRKLNIIDFNEPGIVSQYTLSKIDDDGWREKVLNFLQEIDISIYDIKVQKREIFELPGFNKVSKKRQSALLAEQNSDKKFRSAQFLHLDNQEKPVPIKLENESSGTISLFAISGIILDVLEKGSVLVVDGLNSGLHPHAFRHLVNKFDDPDSNKRDAQLIFTTHETSITENDSICSDQIWMVEKDKNLTAHLIPVSDFRNDDGRPFRKSYLQGRYGAVPRIRSM